MKGAKALVETLKAENTKYVFGIPGTHVLSIYDELFQSDISTIQATQEQSAGFMADVYGRVSHKPGILLVTAGPGVINTANSIAQAYVESSPVIVLGAQCNQNLWGKGCYHELKHPDVQMNIFRDITKWSARISSAREISEVLTRAFAEATSGRHRPVFVEIPEDVPDQQIESVSISIRKPEKMKAENEDLNKVLEEIRNAEKPVIIAGGGIFASEAQTELMEFSKCFEIPITTTIMGKSTCPFDFEYSLGIGSGILAGAGAKKWISEADLMIAIGTRFGEIATGFFTLKVPKKLIHIDIDANEFNRNYTAEIAIQADAKTCLRQLLNLTKTLTMPEFSKNRGVMIRQIRTQTLTEYEHDYEETTLVNPQKLLDRLIERLAGKKVIFVGDAGNNTMWLLGCKSMSTHRIITPSGYNSMGISVPGGIGAKLAQPESEVVCICGDGSFLMTGLEMLTAIKYKLKIMCIVFHDRKYNILRFFQDMKYEGRYADSDIKTFDFAKFINDAGGLGINLGTNSEIEDALSKALLYDGPSLIDVAVDSKLIPPILKKLKRR